MMTTLAAILIPLSLLQAAPGHAEQQSGYKGFTRPPHTKTLYVGRFPTEVLLDVLGRDVAEDIIQYYNKLTASGKISPVLSIPDVKDNYVIGKSSYNISATKGSMTRGKLLSLPDPIEVAFADYMDGPEHLVTANIPISILNTELKYKELNVKMKIVDANQSVDVKIGGPKAKGAARSKGAAKPTGAAKVIIGSNKFVLDTDLVHKINIEDGSIQCYVTVRNITVERFDVKKVEIENVDEVGTTILDTFANDFKNSLLKKSYAAQLMRVLVDEALPIIIPPYCIYLRPDEADKIITLTPLGPKSPVRKSQRHLHNYLTEKRKLGKETDAVLKHRSTARQNFL